MVIDVITATNSVYRIDLDGNSCQKFVQGRSTSEVNQLHGMQIADPAQYRAVMVKPWEDKTGNVWVEADYPKIGNHLYLNSRTCGFITTPVARIVEVDNLAAPLTEVESPAES